MDIVTQVLILLDKIPATFWGVVTGSFFSILGVYLSNRSSEKRLLSQFEHERILKTKEREMTLRKEVFLAAAEALHIGTTTIGKFANLDNVEVTKEYLEKAPAIAKVHVIGNSESVIALSNVSNELASVFLRLAAKRHKLLALRGKILFLDTQIASFSKDRDRFVEMMRQYNIDGIINQQRWTMLNNNYEFEQKRAIDTNTERTIIAQELEQKHLLFWQDCISEASRFTDFIIPLIISVRNELELPIDLEAYKAVIEDGKARQKMAVEAYLQEVLPPNSTQQLKSDITSTNT